MKLKFAAQLDPHYILLVLRTLLHAGEIIWLWWCLVVVMCIELTINAVAVSSAHRI